MTDPKEKKTPKGSSTAKRILQILKELRKRPLTFEQIQRQFPKENGKPLPRTTLYRDFDTIRELGFPIDNQYEKYHIPDTEGSLDGLNDLNQEEVILIREALLQYASTNPLRNDIFQKLVSTDDLKPLADILVRQQDIENIARLTEAIRLNKRVILRGYDSTGSQRPNRVVEPKRFLKEYQKVDCCEINPVKIKTFNIERIGSVEILDEPQSLNPEYEKMDIFGQSGFESNPVELRLTKRAKLILEMESHDARQYIRDDGGNKYRLKTFYTRFEGVTRFILSLPGEIEILHTETLRQHLNEELNKLKNGKW
jgi:predicted DNA-binding transcriptional regulator YafY